MHLETGSLSWITWLAQSNHMSPSEQRTSSGCGQRGQKGKSESDDMWEGLLMQLPVWQWKGQGDKENRWH